MVQQEHNFKTTIDDFNRRNHAIAEALKALDSKLTTDFKRIDERIDNCAGMTKDGNFLTIRSKGGKSFYNTKQS